MITKLPQFFCGYHQKNWGLFIGGRGTTMIKAFSLCVLSYNEYNRLFRYHLNWLPIYRKASTCSLSNDPSRFNLQSKVTMPPAEITFWA